MNNAEKFIEEHTRNCSNKIQCYDGDCNPCVIYKPWLTPNQALRATEIAREEAVNKACEYIEGLIEFLNEHGHQLRKEQIIKGLKIVMKNE